jgi:phosphoribosylglycinamide formyltransferase-1
VHEAVKKNNEKETGITIHWVNEHYDEGGFIFQARTEITDADSIEDISKKVRALELKWYPKIVEMLTTTEP